MNFSHGTKPKTISARAISMVALTSLPNMASTVGILADLQGPENPRGQVRIRKQDHAEDIGETRSSSMRKCDDRQPGARWHRLQRAAEAMSKFGDDALLLNDGRLKRHGRDRAYAARRSSASVLESAAMLSNNKGINRQGGGLTAPALTAEGHGRHQDAAHDSASTFVAVSFPKIRLPTCTWRASCVRAAGMPGAADRQDRTRRGRSPFSGRNPGRLRRRHGGPRRSGRGSRRRCGAGAAEAHDPHGARA